MKSAYHIILFFARCVNDFSVGRQKNIRFLKFFPLSAGALRAFAPLLNANLCPSSVLKSRLWHI